MVHRQTVHDQKAEIEAGLMKRILFKFLVDNGLTYGFIYSL